VLASSFFLPLCNFSYTKPVNMKILNLIVILVLLTHCQIIKQTTDESKLDKVIEEHFDGNVTLVPNSSETFVIISQTNKPSMQVPVNALKFGVYDVQKETLVYSEQKYNATVVWYNDEYILIKSRPGMKSTDVDTDRAMKQYYINVKTLKKFTHLPNNN